ncbi:MAG: putative ABC transporter permease subunit [Gemmatimonadaceae bacterium]
MRELFHLLLPKWWTARARSTASARGRASRWLFFAIAGAFFWVFVFGVLFRVLGYFRGIPEIGALLAGKLLGMMLLSFFALLLLSNIVTSLSSFFLARDLDLLVSAPVDWLRLYGAKLLETAVNSSWMVVLMALPVFTAYGLIYQGGWWFPLVALAIFVPLLLIPAVLGSAITLLLVNIFPARRTRDILGLVTVLSAAAVALLVRLIRPEQLARPESFRSLVDFIALLRTPASPVLPSEWAQAGMMSWLTYEPDYLPFFLLWSTTAGLIVLGAALHQRLYAPGFSKSQESASRFKKPDPAKGFARRMLAPLSIRRREMVLKEMRIFFRDTTQWSQLILLAVLVAVYIFNIKFLPLRTEGVTFLLANIVPFLNLAIAGFVLSAVAARFVFPSVSLEGRTLWLLRSSPLPMKDVLWSKFWVGTLPLLIVALAIVFITNVLLQVTEFMMFVSIATITLLTFALSGLAMGFGTMFPQYETENAAQIPTSFGGLFYMMTSIALIGAVVVLEARPVYSYVRQATYRGGADPTEMVVGFGLVTLLCVAATLIPLRVAVKKLELGET